MAADWRFARQPFWLFSHAFAGVVIVSFVALGLWQLDRLGQRQDANRLIEERTAEVLDLDTGALAGLTAGGDGSAVDYQAVRATVRTVESDLGRVVNRTANGVAGEHVVAVVELADGTELAANRGFVPLVPVIDPDPLPPGPVVVTGWLRATVERGWLGATDDGTGDELPRFDTERVATRLGRDLPPAWLQIETVDGAAPAGAAIPEPIPLPPLDDGPHLGYAVQWFIFATLGVIFYGLLVGRRATGHRSTITIGGEAVPLPDDLEPADGSLAGSGGPATGATPEAPVDARS